VMGLVSIELPGGPIPDRRIAELVRSFDNCFYWNNIPFAFNSHPVSILGDIPLILRRMSVGCFAAPFSVFIRQSLNPFS